MTMQKVGYDGTYLMELANTGVAGGRAGAGARRARQKFEKLLRVLRSIDETTADDRLHRRHRARTTGRPVRLRGWLHNRRSSGKIHFLTLRDGTGFIQCVMSKAAVGEEMFTARRPPRRRRAPSSSTAPRAPTRARRAATRSTSTSLEIVVGGEGLPDHAEGARRRLPDGSPPPVDPLAAAAGDPARPPRGDQRGPRLLQRPRLHPRRHADLHAGGVRRHDDALPGRSTSRTRRPT